LKLQQFRLIERGDVRLVQEKFSVNSGRWLMKDANAKEQQCCSTHPEVLLI